MYTSESHIEVRYKETDRMGIVYHSNYYVWFDVGRTDFLRSVGWDYKDLEEDGILFPVIETRCFYKLPSHYSDKLIVRTCIEKIKGIRITFKYKIIRETDSAVIAEGNTVHAFADQNLKPINIKKRNPELLEALNNCI